MNVASVTEERETPEKQQTQKVSQQQNLVVLEVVGFKHPKLLNTKLIEFLSLDKRLVREMIHKFYIINY